MWQHFLHNWNGVALFLVNQATSLPKLQLYSDDSGSLGYGGFFEGKWATGSPTTPSAKTEVLVLNGRSYLRYSWPDYFMGSPLVRVKNPHVV